MTTTWQVKQFRELNIDELYEILKLRIDVFVVEQTCFYPDLDDIDRHKETIHLFCYIEGKIAGYLRILAKCGGSKLITTKRKKKNTQVPTH